MKIYINYVYLDQTYLGLYINKKLELILSVINSNNKII